MIPQSSSENSLFGSFNDTFADELAFCQHYWPNITVRREAYDTYYGSTQISKSLSNALIINGAKDPWRPLCISDSVSETVQILTTDSSHCADAALHHTYAGLSANISAVQQQEIDWFQQIANKK
jgi:hypothetical protein